MSQTIAVLGAGSWGTALSLVLAQNEHTVSLWTHKEEHAEFLNRKRENPQYLKNVYLPRNITVTSNLEQVLKGKKHIVLVTPSHSLQELLPRIGQYMEPDASITHAIKGIDPETLERVSEVVLRKLPGFSGERLAVLSGPSHAEEVALQKPTTVVIASKAPELAETMQDIFFNNNFRVYTNSDVIGVELGGALKNIIALGAGVSDGLGFGDNAKAALMTRGLAEITRLGIRLGAMQSTFSGLAGIGDLIVTCTSVHSRNYRAGRLIGQGKPLDAVLKEMGMVVEGVRTTKAAYALSRTYDVSMPITEQLYQMLFANKNAKEAVEQLMARDKKEELESFH